MTLADPRTITIPQAGPRPRDDELDLYGVTHPGKVRAENQDHFLVATVHQQVQLHATSLDPEQLPLASVRLGTLALVADGVGGGNAGRQASRIAVETASSYVSSTVACFQAAARGADDDLYDALLAAALEANRKVQAEAADHGDAKGMATTLTLAFAVWPSLYVLQVGDSRLYYYDEDRLLQVTRDQTVAQDLVDAGVLPRERAAASPFGHVLASSIGGKETMPAVSKLALHRGSVTLLCSDGLTKHVTDAEISDHLRDITSSEATCRALLDLALERGGSDNITVLIGRVRGGRNSTPLP